jgi:hypothetical protein
MPRTASSRVCRFIRRPCHIRGRCGEVQSAAAVWRRSPMPRSACRPQVSCPRKKRGVAGTADWLVPAMNPQRRLRAQRSEGPPLAILGTRITLTGPAAAVSRQCGEPRHDLM